MKFRCDKCGTRYTIADEKVRNKVLKIRCKVCEHVIQVSDPELGLGNPQTPAPVAAPVAASPRPNTFAQNAQADANATAVSVSPARAALMAAAQTAVPSIGRIGPEDSLAPSDDVEWYAAPDSGQVGPMPLERLLDLCRSGAVKGDDFVWNERMADWQAAAGVADLAVVFKPKAAPKPPPLPPPAPAPQPVIVAAPKRSTGPVRAVTPLVDEEATAFGPPDVAPSVPERLDFDLLAAPPPPAPPQDELSSLMDAELGAQATALATGAPPAHAPVSVGTSRSLGGLGGFGEDLVSDTLHAQATVLQPAGLETSDTVLGAPAALGAAAVFPAPLNAGTGPVVVAEPRRKGLPSWTLMAAAGLALIVGGVGLGVALAPTSGGDPVAAQQAPPTLSPATAAAPPSIVAAVAPTGAPPTAPTAPESVATAPTAPATEAHAADSHAADGHAADRHGKSEDAPSHEAKAPKRAEAEQPRIVATEPAKPSAFAGLDKARGSVAPTAPVDHHKAAQVDKPDSLSQAEITAVLKRNQKALQGCYMRQLKRDDSLANGRATLRFRIHKDGRPRDVGLEKRYDGTVLKQCLVSVVERWVFPEFDGDPIPVEYPLIFQASM